MSIARESLMTPGEAARILRLTPTRLTKLARAGEIPAVLLPRDEVRFVEEDLRAWIDEHKTQGAGGE